MTTAFALALAFALAAEPAGASADALETGRRLTALFRAREISQLWEELGPQLRSMLGGPEGLARFRRRVDAQLGPELRVINENVSSAGGVTTYTRTATFELAAQPFRIVWTFDAAGIAEGLSVQPAPAPPTAEAASRHLGRATRTALRLPFEGEWTVFWGGRTLEENQHARAVDQRFALDLVVAVDGATHGSEGAGNAAYHCWGRPILAPGPGLVVAADAGVGDNSPGETNRGKPLGNHVVIDHMNGEYSLLAHLQQGSVTVTIGQQVAAGDALGRCGNSGYSSEPHLHYHLQDSPEFGAGQGLPAQFRDYVADGVPVARGEPTRGQKIRPGP